MISLGNIVRIWMILANAAFAATTQIISTESPRVFSGSPSAIEVRFQNSTETMFESDVFMRIFQLSSSTAMPVTSRERWNTLKVLAHQTIVEHVRFQLPSVRAETRFEIRWSDSQGTVMGTTAIDAYPTNVLAKLTGFCAAKELGVFDPESRLKPLLDAAGVEFVDVGQSTFEDFRGRLMIAFLNDPGQHARLFKMLRRGVNIVLISVKAEEDSSENFVTVNRSREACWALVHPRAVGVLKTDVASQLRLISIARLVTNTNHYDLITQP